MQSQILLALKELKNIVDRDFAVFDSEMQPLVYTSAHIPQGSDYTLFRVGGSSFFSGAYKSEVFGKIAALHLKSIITPSKERAEKEMFLKNLLTGQVSDVDIPSFSKIFGIETVSRTLFLIETILDEETSQVDIIKSIFPAKGEYVVVPEINTIVLLTAVKDEPYKTARIIYDTLLAEGMAGSYIVFRTGIDNLAAVEGSYNQAKKALEISKVFEPEKYVINCEKLGLGQLVFNLPHEYRQKFLDEILPVATLKSLDSETLATAGKFLENNLNISETSRQLYIHRNTLVYRLDKLHKNTGLDLRLFHDAVLFHMVMLLKLISSPLKENTTP